MDPAGDMRRQGLAALFRNGNFSLLWSSTLASQLGDHINLMALTALIFSLGAGPTRGLEFSKILLLASVPVLIFGPISGVYADRLNRKKIMIVSDLLRAGLVVSIPFISHSMPVIYAIIFIVFTINRFFLSARSAAIPQIVESDELMPANSLLNVAMMATIMLGPWGGGVLVQRLGYRAGFFVDATTYLASALFMSFVTLKALSTGRAEGRVRPHFRHVPGTHREGEHSFARGRLADEAARLAEEAARLGREIAAPIEEEVEVIGSAYQRLVADLKDGFSRIKGNRSVLFSTISFSAIMFVAGFVIIASPVLVRNEFGLGTAELGMLFSVAGVGMLVGSLVVGRFFHSAPRRGIIAASFFLAGVDTMIFARAASVPALGLGIFLVGFFVAPTMVTCDTILQESMPGKSVGKAFGFRDMVSKASFGVAGVLSGIIVDIVGPRHLLVTIGLGCVAYAALSTFLLADTTKLNLLNFYPLTKAGLVVVGSVPRPVSRIAALILSEIAYLMMPQKRRSARCNVARVIGKPPRSREARVLARRIFHSYGRYYADFFGLSAMHGAEVSREVRIVGLEHLKSALEKGRGVVFVTAHIGGWDVGGAALAATDGLPRLSAIVEPVERENSNHAVTAMREVGGVSVIPVGKPMRVWRALRRNEIVFMVAERLIGADGIKVKFFGEETALPKGAAYWALKCGAPIVPGFSIRQPDGSYVAHIEAPIDPEPGDDFELDLKKHTQRLANIMAKYIASYPEQWCMLQPVWQDR